eukprot:262745_1
MSKGSSKRSAKSSKTSTTDNSPATKPNASQDDDNMIVKFVMMRTTGQKFHARSPICFDSLTLDDLLQKTSLDLAVPAPTARQLFEIYFKEEIHPYVHHQIQCHLRNKRDILKLWDVQSNRLQNIYEHRAKLLKEEWLRRRQVNKQPRKQKQDDTDPESAKRKAKLKAKNKANKQKWADEIAMRIASGQFDQIEPSPPQQKQVKPPKKTNPKKKKAPSKTTKKKKKLKKWKDKKPKKAKEIWPVMNPKDKTNDKTKDNSSTGSSASPIKTPIAEILKEKSEKPKPIKLENKSEKPKIHSELRYTFVMWSDDKEYVMDDEMEHKQMQSLNEYIDDGCNDLVLIKIRIHMDSWIHMEHMLLNTDKDHVVLTVNQQNINLKLFEILWNNFGHAIKERIDTQHINVAFVKKSNTLRVKIPILSI